MARRRSTPDLDRGPSSSPRKNLGPVLPFWKGPGTRGKEGNWNKPETEVPPLPSPPPPCEQTDKLKTLDLSSRRAS